MLDYITEYLYYYIIIALIVICFIVVLLKLKKISNDIKNVKKAIKNNKEKQHSNYII